MGTQLNPCSGGSRIYIKGDRLYTARPSGLKLEAWKAHRWGGVLGRGYRAPSHQLGACMRSAVRFPSRAIRAGFSCIFNFFQCYILCIKLSISFNFYKKNCLPKEGAIAPSPFAGFATDPMVPVFHCSRGSHWIHKLSNGDLMDPHTGKCENPWDVHDGREKLGNSNSHWEFL